SWARSSAVHGMAPSRAPICLRIWSRRGSARAREMRANCRSVRRRTSAAPDRPSRPPFLDRIDTVGVERQMVANGRDGVVGSLVGPYGVDGALPADGDAVVRGVSLVGTVAGVVRATEKRQIDVAARNVLDRRV